MSFYTKEELILKNYDELYKIAVDERLINLFSKDRTKQELIELILEYREDKYDKKIVDLNLESFQKLQEIIDEHLVIIEKQVMDIEVPRKIIIYQDILFNEEIDEYHILISKNLDINTDFVLLTGKNLYIYCIFSLKLDIEYRSDKYLKYIFSNKYVERFDFDKEFCEDVKLVFFNNQMANLLMEIYKFQQTQYIPEKIYCYSVKILEIKVKKTTISSYKFPILFVENKIICKYFTKEFSMYIKKIDTNKIYVEYFENAKDILTKRNNIFYGTYFNDIEKFFSNSSEYIEIYDDFFKMLRINKKKLINLFLNEIIELIQSFSKCKFDKFYSVGLDLRNEKFEYLSINFLINYSLFSKKIVSKLDTYKSDKYLIITSEINAFKITSNNYSIIEKDINYMVKIESTLNLKEKGLSYNKLLHKIMNLIKFKILNIPQENLFLKEKIEYLMNNGFENYQKDFLKNVDQAEKIYKTAYYNYEQSLNSEYTTIQKNYYDLYDISKRIVDEYNVNPEETEYKIEEYKIVLKKNEINLILCAEMYNFLNNFFKDFKIFEILNIYKGINLFGIFVKSELFYNLLKEFIPGKIIHFSQDFKNNYNNILETVANYIEDIDKAKVIVKNNYMIDKIKYEIYCYNFKNELKLIMDTKNENVGYVDKLASISILEIFIHDLNKNRKYNLNLNITKKFYERDEIETKINQNYLNDIENEIVRIFFKYEEKLTYFCAKRMADQVYITDEIAIKFDSV